MRKAASRLLTSRIARNAAALYLVQGCRKLLPLVTLPYLARVLGPSGWGSVAFAQSMGDFIAVFAEFGFALSATREIARHRDSRQACGMIASSTLGAQVLLTGVGVIAAGLIAMEVPLLRLHPQLLFAGLLYGAAQGIAPTWLYQGLERMTLAAALEVSSKLCALVAILVFVHSPGDAWKALAFQGITPLVTSGVGIWMAYHIFRFSLPTRTMIWGALRSGWHMFLLRSGVAMYSTANVLVLGIFASSSVVGYYAAAEKLSKAIAGLLTPIRDAFYPRLSQLAAHSPSEGRRLTRISAAIEVACGVILSVATWFGAGILMRTVYGKSFGVAIPILQILAILPFIISLTDAIGLQSLLPAGKEAMVSKAIGLGAVLNLSLAALLAPRYLGMGTAISVVIAEGAVAGMLIWLVSRTTRLFKSGQPSQSGTLIFANAGLDLPPTRNPE